MCHLCLCGTWTDRNIGDCAHLIYGGTLVGSIARTRFHQQQSQMNICGQHRRAARPGPGSESQNTGCYIYFDAPA